MPFRCLKLSSLAMPKSDLSLGNGLRTISMFAIFFNFYFILFARLGLFFSYLMSIFARIFFPNM